MAIQRSFQGMALTGKAYASAAIQGTGVNPIHGLRTGEGRNTAPDGTDLSVPASLTTTDDWGYMTEDCNPVWGAHESSTQTGTDEVPGWGQPSPRGAVSEGYPAWGETPTGAAKGEAIRSLNKGGTSTVTANVRPISNGAEGWLNKEEGQVIEPGSGISSPVQYTMQTSMQQLRRTRAGSQSSGTASKQSAPIQSRVPGQFVRQYGLPSGARHRAMTPTTQHVRLRPFRNRTAGTGRRAELKPNAMYMSIPLTRTAPPDPYQGASVPLSSDYGYTSEDGTY